MDYLKTIQDNLDNQSQLIHEFWLLSSREYDVAAVEEVVSGSPVASTLYCLFLKKDKAPNLEATIAQDANASMRYHCNLFNGERFELGESGIIKDDLLLQKYIEQLKPQHRIPELEPYIHKSIEALLRYLFTIEYDFEYFKEAEEIIKKDPEACFLYALYVINDRFYEGEEVMKEHPDVWKKYLDIFA